MLAGDILLKLQVTLSGWSEELKLRKAINSEKTKTLINVRVDEEGLVVTCNGVLFYFLDSRAKHEKVDQKVDDDTFQRQRKE